MPPITREKLSKKEKKQRKKETVQDHSKNNTRDAHDYASKSPSKGDLHPTNR